MLRLSSLPHTGSARARKRSLLARGFVLLCFLACAGAQCFPRQCKTYEHCQRSCDCYDNSNNTSVTCPIAFDCDVQNEVCADDYTMTCDEICGRYAARSACGSKTCVDEGDCVRRALCDAVHPTTGALVCTYTCDVTFGCDAEAGVCDAAFMLEDAQICASGLCPLPSDGSCG